MKVFQLRLLNLSVFHQTEENGDELLIKLNGKRIWPLNERYFSVKPEGKVNLNYSMDIPFTDRTFEFQLWEYDNVFSSQCLGSFYLRTDKNGGPFLTDLSVNAGIFAKYSIEWSLTEKFQKINI